MGETKACASTACPNNGAIADGEAIMMSGWKESDAPLDFCSNDCIYDWHLERLVAEEKAPPEQLDEFRRQRRSWL
jgi:hypothetical protein